MVIACRRMRTLTFNRIVGLGAMGTVYHATLAEPGGFTRQCAVKVIKTSSPDQAHFRARMRDEARLLGLLQDEQILGATELIRIGGRDCVVMEYVEGVDLAALLKEHRVPPRALAELGAETAGTLHRAHAAVHPSSGAPLHVIHRDVKPANCMVTWRGGVRLLDFGVARAAFESRESKTQGLVLGTLNYFPPEILAGAEPTPAVDIYGLGLTLWECATGRSWGSPQVHRHRFERRVEQRLAEIDASYAPIADVLRAILRWEPGARPSGAEVERMLLTTIRSCPEPGLRAWSRQVVPGLLTIEIPTPKDDPLVGRTLPIEGAIPLDVPEPAAPEPIVPRFVVGEREPVSPDMPTTPMHTGPDGTPRLATEADDDPDDLCLSEPIAVGGLAARVAELPPHQPSLPPTQPRPVEPTEPPAQLVAPQLPAKPRPSTSSQATLNNVTLLVAAAAASGMGSVVVVLLFAVVVLVVLLIVQSL